MFTVTDLIREIRFLAKRRYLRLFFLAILVLSTFSVWTGVSEYREQQSTIASLLEKDQQARDKVLAKQTDYGSAAYYSFHLTYSLPMPMMFAAIGQRDVFPWKHRIRMLALEGQIYESDTTNAELTSLGRFDFAFLVSILAPLFVILLIHDLRTSEQEAGRYDLLITTARSSHALWSSRAVVVVTALVLMLLVPFIVGAIYVQAKPLTIFLMTIITITHVMFWALLTLSLGKVFARKGKSSAMIASTLLGIWLLLSVIFPVVSDAFIQQLIKSPSGAELVLLQRESVNDAWDLPYETTWEAFLKTHPEWKDKTEMKGLFEWKWYYAFQQVGDQKTAERSRQYRDAIQQKDKAAGLLAYLSPPVLSQRLMARLAHTDTNAALEYEQNVRDFHKSLRMFFYPLFFNNDEYRLEKLNQLPKFKARQYQ